MAATKTKTATQLLTVPQVAERLGCGRGHVYTLIAAGAFREVTDISHTGRPKHRIREDVLADYIASRSRPIHAQRPA